VYDNKISVGHCFMLHPEPPCGNQSERVIQTVAMHDLLLSLRLSYTLTS